MSFKQKNLSNPSCLKKDEQIAEKQQHPCSYCRELLYKSKIVITLIISVGIMIHSGESVSTEERGEVDTVDIVDIIDTGEYCSSIPNPHSSCSADNDVWDIGWVMVSSNAIIYISPTMDVNIHFDEALLPTILSPISTSIHHPQFPKPSVSEESSSHYCVKLNNTGFKGC